jgi:hypothetical protein
MIKYLPIHTRNHKHRGRYNLPLWGNSHIVSYMITVNCKQPRQRPCEYKDADSSGVSPNYKTHLLQPSFGTPIQPEQMFL